MWYVKKSILKDIMCYPAGFERWNKLISLSCKPPFGSKSVIWSLNNVSEEYVAVDTKQTIITQYKGTRHGVEYDRGRLYQNKERRNFIFMFGKTELVWNLQSKCPLKLIPGGFYSVECSFDQKAYFYGIHITIHEIDFLSAREKGNN